MMPMSLQSLQTIASGKCLNVNVYGFAIDCFAILFGATNGDDLILRFIYISCFTVVLGAMQTTEVILHLFTF